MIEMPSGASGMSTVERCTRCAPESCHSIVARASPGHGGPSGGLASRVHSPTSGSSRLSASSAVGWSIAALLPLVGGCELHQLLVALPHPTPPFSQAPRGLRLSDVCPLSSGPDLSPLSSTLVIAILRRNGPRPFRRSVYAPDSLHLGQPLAQLQLDPLVDPALIRRHFSNPMR